MKVTSATSTSFSLDRLTFGLRLLSSSIYQDKDRFKTGTNGHFTLSGDQITLFPDFRAEKKEDNHTIISGVNPRRFLMKAKVDANFTQGDGRKIGLLLNHKDENNYLAISVDSSGYIKFTKTENGKESILKSLKMENPPKGEFDMALNVNINRYEFYINGEKVLNETEKSFSDGDFALASMLAPVTFSDLKIYNG